MTQVLMSGITPIKILLASLFFILGVGEFLDGIYDVGDYAVPMFVILILNDLFISSKGRRRSFNYTVPSVERRFTPKKLLKWSMNIFFFFMLVSPVLMELMDLGRIYREGVFKVATVIWAGAFLAISINKLRDSFRIPQFIICNVALLMFVGSVCLI